MQVQLNLMRKVYRVIAKIKVLIMIAIEVVMKFLIMCVEMRLKEVVACVGMFSVDIAENCSVK